MNVRTVLTAFAVGAAVSFLAGVFTSGLAAAYAFVAMLVWNILARSGGESLANQRWLVVTFSALVHGLLFAGFVTLAGLAFPRLKETQLGGNLLLVGALAYGVLLAFAFPVTP
jgi:hypothetical protein